MNLSRNKLKIYALYAFAFVGVLVSAYLWYEYSQPGEVTCQLSGCQSVRESEYAKLLGIDLPVYGFFFYLAICLYAMSLLGNRKRGVIERGAFLAVITGGLGFSIYLTYLEAFVIHAWCQWCVISALMSVGVYFVGYWMEDPISLWGKLRSLRG